MLCYDTLPYTFPKNFQSSPFCFDCFIVSVFVQGVTHVICTICFPSGEYFCDCKIKAPNKLALDEEAAENLWKKSEEWTGL